MSRILLKHYNERYTKRLRTPTARKEEKMLTYLLYKGDRPAMSDKNALTLPQKIKEKGE